MSSNDDYDYDFENWPERRMGLPEWFLKDVQERYRKIREESKFIEEGNANQRWLRKKIESEHVRIDGAEVLKRAPREFIDPLFEDIMTRNGPWGSEKWGKYGA